MTERIILLVYRLGRALYRNLRRKVFKCGVLAVAFDMRVPARFRGDCHGRSAGAKGRVVGDGGRVGVDSWVILVVDDVVVCVRRKCIDSCL